MGAETFLRLQQTYGFTIVNGDRPVEVINRELQHKIESVLVGKSD
jgi:hypothetical protein